MEKFSILIMFVFLFVASIVYAVPQNLNVDFQVHNDTGVALNTSYSGVVRIYETGSGSPTYSQSVSWRTDNSGVGNLFLTNVNLLNDVQHELTIQPTGESESDRLNISGNLQAIFSANSTYAAGVSCSDIDGTASNLCTLADTNTQLTQEQVEDFAGGMVSGNTETRITVTYQDGDGTVDFVVDDMNYDDSLLTAQMQNGTSFVNAVNTSVSDRLNGLNSSSTTDELFDDSAILATITVLTFNISDINLSLSTRMDDLGSSFDNSGNTANFTTLFAYSLDNATHNAAQNLTLEQLIGFNCGAGDFVNSIGADGLPSCGTPVGGGGGAGDKWIFNSSLNAVVPNESFSDNIATLPNRFVNASLLYSDGLESGTQQNITVSQTSGVWSFIVTLTSFNWNDLTNVPNWITSTFDQTVQSWINGNVTVVHSNTDVKVLGNVSLVNSNTDLKVNSNRSAEAGNTDLKVTGNVTTDTNANTLCSGTTTYLDGEGNCDDISTSYESATSNNIDPDRLNGDTTDDNLVDTAILQTDVAQTDQDNQFSTNQTIQAGLVVDDNASINGLFIGKINSSHWRIG